MKKLVLFAILTGTILHGGARATPLPRSTPEEQGVAPAGIIEFIQAADAGVKDMHSFMMMRHGKVVAEAWWTPYSAQSRHSLYSLSKSFTSTAVGMAIGEGKLSVSDEALKFFPDDAPENPSANLKSMRIRDLLRMSTGHQSEPSLGNATGIWTKIFLAHAVPNKPGTHFLYNTAATYMLSAMVQKATGETVLDYLRPRLFEPLGIESPEWGTSPQGITLGGYGLSIRTEDIARFGQLYLQHGNWNGRQLVPAEWVAAATSLQTANGSSPESDWDQGYGYQFWRCRHDIFRGDGAFGQFCIVMPKQDAVVAITSGTKDMQRVLNIVWDKLLPAIKEGTLPPDDSAQSKLAELEKNLSIPVSRGSTTPGRAAEFLGKKYSFEPNAQKIESLALERKEGSKEIVLVMKNNYGEQRVTCGAGEWTKGRMGYDSLKEQPVAASGAWTEDGSFSAKLCFYETPFVVSIHVKPSDEALTWIAEWNAAFGAAKKPELTGRAQ